MVSLSYSASIPSDDPVFVRTHFLGRVASDALGLEYQHELLKRRSSRHSDLNRWDANWLAPVTHTMSYDTDDTTDTDDDVLNNSHAPSQHNKSVAAHQLRSRSSTLPVLYTSNAPVEMARARSMTAPPTAASSFADLRTSRKIRSSSATQSRLLPEHPLTIDTAQPLRLSTSNIATLSTDASPSSSSVQAPSPMPTVQPSPKTCSAPVVRIECSESDGSCHGDAGDQDPEAQLAAGIIRLREQRRSSAHKSQTRRTTTKRRASTTQASSSTPKQSLDTNEDLDSDDADSLLIRNHGGSFVLRLAEMVLDFGSSALEKLVAADAPQLAEDSMAGLQPRRRSSTTPKQLTVEAGELLRRRRERRGTVLPTDSPESSGGTKSTLTRSWSVPKLLSLPLFNPSASLRALSSTTASTPATPSSAPAHLHPNFGFTMASEEPAHNEPSSFDEVGACFVRNSVSLYSKSPKPDNASLEPEQVSPLWKQ